MRSANRLIPLAAALLAVGALPHSAAAQTSQVEQPEITVYKSPT